jgi:glycosyltransferase involved in cell wall biosynthesis
MRILINAVTVSPRSPGNWAHLCNLLEGWKASESPDQILLAANASFPEDLEASLSSFLEVHRSPLGRPGMLVTQHTRIDHLAKAFRAQAVLNATPVAPMIVPVRAPQVTVVHDIRHTVQPAEFRRYQIVYRDVVYLRSIRKSDAVIAVSESTREHLVRELGLDPERIRVVRHGADHVDRWPRGEPGRYGIAFAHWSNKRPEVAVETWARLREADPGFDRGLEIVGAGSGVRPQLESAIAAHRLEDLVRLHAHLPDLAYQQLFSSASIVLLPSTLEGFGLPVIEGLRLGIPVVVTEGAGAGEAGGDAAIYAPGDAESFARECARLFDDDAWRADVVARGRAYAESFTWANAALETRAVLEAVGRPAG